MCLMKKKNCTAVALLHRSALPPLYLLLWATNQVWVTFWITIKGGSSPLCRHSLIRRQYLHTCLCFLLLFGKLLAFSMSIIDTAAPLFQFILMSFLLPNPLILLPIPVFKSPFLLNVVPDAAHDCPIFTCC